VSNPVSNPVSLIDILLLIPLVGFLGALTLPQAGIKFVRLWALFVSSVTFIVSLGIAIGYQPGVKGQQFIHDMVWIVNPEIHYHVGVDGLSLWLVLLTALLSPIAVLLSWNSITYRAKEFFAFLLLLEFGLIGVFVAFDLFLFYLFWELVLVPMYFIIGIWGGEKRIYAAVKFFVYTMAGSVFMLGAIVYLTNLAGTSNYSDIVDGFVNGKFVLSSQAELLLFLSFFIAFAIKLALFPVHTWLPDAYNSGPAAGTMILAAVMAKMGTYSIVRFCIPMFPQAAHRCASWIIVLALISIIYGACVALIQPNFKKVIAYSSMSHMGFIVLGIFTFTQLGMDGAIYQMVSHGVTIAALFTLVGFLQERKDSVLIEDFGGVANTAPALSAVFLIASLTNIGLPVLSNFVGEFLILQGSAQANFTWTAFGSIGVILSACYMLWMYQRVFQGEKRFTTSDLNFREYVCVVPLVILMVWMGTYTQSFLPVVSNTTRQILDQSSTNVPLRVGAPRQTGTEVARAR
jgi:NADH-quinone oxidoreductase subunit M